MPGISPNLHEGFRSEYLAQYVFASFGAAASVPSQEDYGLDLHCTLVERKGVVAWPKAYFSVQVKSKSDEVSWKFKSQEEVRWLIEYPLPLFLCVVNKKEARLEVYQTMKRFEVWTLPPFPQSLELVPGSSADGDLMKWEEGGQRSLGAPILDFSILDMLDDNFHELVQQILIEWIKFEQTNLNRIRNGLYWMGQPAQYQTNSSVLKGITWLGLGQASKEEMQLALQSLQEQLAWIIPQLEQKNDFASAARAALLHRHLFPNASAPFDINPFFLKRMNARFNSAKYVYHGIDQLNQRVDQTIEELSDHTK